MKRRLFLGLVGSGVAGVTLGQVGLARLLPRKAPSVAGPSGLGLAEEREALSVCGGCAAGCSTLVRLVDERIVGVRGNPRCPLGSGGLCARGVSEVEAFYEPDRLLGPMRREGDRGAGRWKGETWDVALAEICSRVKALVGAQRGARVGFILSSGEGVTAAVARHVASLLGSPHVYRVTHLRDESALAYSSLAFGSPRPHGYDLDRADLVMSFGTPLLEGWLSPNYVSRRFGLGRTRALDPLRLFQVESRMSPTAMRADEWIRCHPGTEPMLALAMAGVMLREGLVDQRRVEQLAGLDAWQDAQGAKRPGFRRMLDYAYARHAAAEDTGVPVVTILRLARTFATSKAPLALGELGEGSAGVFGLAAVHLLNALAGRVNQPGGVTFPDPAPVAELAEPKKLEALPLDGPPLVTLSGTPIWRVLAAIQTEGGQPPFDVLFVEDGAALADVVARDPASDLLGRIPLVVSLATSLDASAAISDFVLPATTYFEQSVDVEAAPAGRFTAIAASKPAVARLVDGRPAADVLLELGRRVLGAAVGPWTAVGAMVDHRLKGLFRARRGIPYQSEFRHDWMAKMEAAGWWHGSAANEDAFLRLVYAGGGWVDPGPAFRSVGAYAVDGRVHLANRKKASLMAPPEVDDAWMPRAETAETPAEANSFLLVPAAVAVLRGRGTPNRPSLLQVAAPHVLGAFRPWAELNPKDAEKLGVEAGQLVRVASEYGAVVLTARLWEGIRPGTVAVPWAPAAAGTGRNSSGWLPSAERLACGTRSALVGARLARGLLVQIRPANGEQRT
jgi:menaquinone reductase, molybdopterin-binding-like subunit